MIDAHGDPSVYLQPDLALEEEDGDEDSPRVRLAQTRQAMDNCENYERLKESDEIEESLKRRLMEISSTCHDCICPGEVNAHVALVLQQPIWGMSGFLRGRLFD